MKKQYLGDIRDLFKYDLIQQIMKEVGFLQKFTYIPMVTENDSSKEGKKRDFDKAKNEGRPGTKNDKLIKALKEYKKIDADKRDFKKIEEYFKLRNIRIFIYKRDEYFEHGSREEYFKKILEDLPCSSLVFVDPDIGLQIKKSGEKHLLYEEVKCLYKAMDKDSILMIYQRFPQARKKYPEYSPEGRVKTLKKEVTKDLPLCISDNEIFFLFLTKDDNVIKQLKEVIEQYRKDYPEGITLP